MREADFERVEHWLAEKRKGNGYECGTGDEAAPIDDSVVFALLLEGSPRSQSLLNSMLAFEKGCAAGGTIVGEILEQAEPLIGAAKDVGHGLKVEPSKLESSVRASAFFLPQEYRKDSKIEIIARNRRHNRILLAVSYRCGNLCGAGYYVVLQKDGVDWHYVVIRMAWIS